MTLHDGLLHAKRIQILLSIQHLLLFTELLHLAKIHLRQFIEDIMVVSRLHKLCSRFISTIMVPKNLLEWADMMDMTDTLHTIDLRIQDNCHKVRNVEGKLGGRSSIIVCNIAIH